MENGLTKIEEITAEEIDPGLIQAYLQELPDKALRLGIRVLLAFVFFVIGVQVIKLIRRILRKSLIRTNADTGVIQFLDSFIKAALYVLLLFMIASGFGLDAASVVALVGSAGVAIGLAIQGSLSNFAGGVLILLLKPFKVGDYIMIGDGSSQGTVQEIQLFYTKLATADNHMLIIPNGSLTTSNITNVNTLEGRRLDIGVGIAYDADIKTAKEALLKVLEEDEAVLKEKERLVFVNELADSSVNLTLRCWCQNEAYWETKWRITEKVKYALEEAGISIPFPQMDIHLEQKIHS
ncbi:MAG: mechanosensitive ion channel [Clostridiales bacterium]|nr:mechanosensitive ion channel [Clostridiales bacterium]